MWVEVGILLSPQRDEVSAGCTGASEKTTRRAGLFCAVVKIIMWNCMQRIFHTLLACIATMVVVKRDSRVSTTQQAKKS